MRKFCGAVLIAVALSAMTFDAGAVRAQSGIIQIEQGDGTFLAGRLFGDEKLHYTTTDDGYLVMPNKEGIYEYAFPDENGLPVLSGIRATSSSRRSFQEQAMLQKLDSKALISAKVKKAEESSALNMRSFDQAAPGEPKYLYSTAAFPLEGSPRSLVILVNYTDIKFSMSDPLDYYHDFLNSDNFTANEATGSCRQYFIDNSNGVFKPQFDVYGPVQLANRRNYYGGTYNREDDGRAHEMVVEAVKALDETVDFSVYDHNNDGYVDNVYIIYAGTGQANGGPEDSVWPHSWELEMLNVSLVADGVKFNTYGCSNELKGNVPEGIGTYTHEFCHVLGLPDIYNTYNSSDFSTPDEWSVLDGGPYNNNGRTPPNMSAFERYSLGWIKPQEILSAGGYEVGNLADTNYAYIMTTEKNPDEFYMLEYRLQEGWDKYLPNHGVLIWHIDYNKALWDANMPNYQRNHQCIKLMCADGNASYKDLSGDAFPGTENKTEFSFTTSPKLADWNGRQLNVTGIYDIAEGERKGSFRAEVNEDRSHLNKVEGLGEDTENISFANGVISTNAGTHSVYDLSGRKVGEVSETRSLKVDKGIYIVKGKKLMVK